MVLSNRPGDLHRRPDTNTRPTTGPFRQSDDSRQNNSRSEVSFVLQREVQRQIVPELENHKVDLSKPQTQQVQTLVEKIIVQLIEVEAGKQHLSLSRAESKTLFESCIDEIYGHGPIEPLLKDETITEIMVNGPHDVRVEQHGLVVQTAIKFQDNDHVMRILTRIAGRSGRRIDESQPMVDTRLPDGSRVNAIIPPLSLNGPVITIRKFAKRPFKPEDLVQRGAITTDVLQFLEAAVKSGLNIIVSGGTNSGKTTLLNVLSVYIPVNERIITIEDSAELQLQQGHVIRLESRPESIEKKNSVTIRELLVNTLRMRPDRIIIGECRGAEALDMLQALNTGHDGSMTTLHANNPRDALKRLEVLVLHGADLPLVAIREQIASAINLIVHTSHLEDGSRCIVAVSEVHRGTGDRIEVDDIFEYDRTLPSVLPNKMGRLRATGITPRCIDLLESKGHHLPPTLFRRHPMK